MTGMRLTDLHAHILPGVDDGARTEAEAVRMLDEASAAGVVTLVATPHQNGRSAPREKCREAYDRLVPLARARGIELLLGFELNVLQIRKTDAWEPYTFSHAGQAQPFLLLELMVDTPLKEAAFLVSGIARRGVTPILAHPERYDFVRKDPRAAQELRAYGGLLQVDAGALLAPLFNPERRAARRLLSLGMVDCVASDAHRPGDYTRFAKACKGLAGKLQRGCSLF